jgi:hypothetical protein
VCRQLGAFDQYRWLHRFWRNLSQSLRKQFGQMGFEIQDNGHETAPVKRRGLYHLGTTDLRMRRFQTCSAIKAQSRSQNAAVTDNSCLLSQMVTIFSCHTVNSHSAHGSFCLVYKPIIPQWRMQVPLNILEVLS